MAEADALREWAVSSAPMPASAASPDQLARHLEFMAAALPSRSIDAETGRKRFAVYASILGDKSSAALGYMARRACETLDWFPTPKQCLEILAAYRPPDSPQHQALLACRYFTQAEFERWLQEVRLGAPIGEVPDHWKRIAAEQGCIRRLQDGTFVSRHHYYGPPRPAYEPPKRTTAPIFAPTVPVSKHGEAGASAGFI